MNVPSVERARITVRVSEHRQPGEVCRTIEFRSSTDDQHRSIRYVFRGTVLPEPLDRLDFAALALLFEAMRTGADLHIEGPVSRVLLANLEELQVFWSVAFPKRYRPFRLTADAEVEPASPVGDRAVLSYSGGLDSNFSLLQHLFGDLGRRKRSIAVAALVHGLDIRLAQKAEFDSAAQRASVILAGVGVPLTLIETDWRPVICGDWEMEHGVAIAACLGQFNGTVSAALIAGGEDYLSLVTPWGLGPIVNPLMGFGDFAFLLDACGHTRSERARLIADHPAIMDSLRVCWVKTQHDGGNCGRCEKCLRTKMNFMANGIAPGASLSPAPTLLQIARIRTRNAAQLILLKDVLRTAERNKVRGAWLAALRVSIELNRFQAVARTLGRPVKQALRRVIRSVRPLRSARLVAPVNDPAAATPVRGISGGL